MSVAKRMRIKEETAVNDSLVIPTENLTRDQMDLFFHRSIMMNDRQRLSWALQTEARVRLAKVTARDDASKLQESLDKTLDSPYLFNIYEESSAPIKNEDEETKNDDLPLGTKVRKKFGRKYYDGVVTRKQVCQDDHGTLEQCYHVNYEDGDEEDLNYNEILPLVVKDAGEFEAPAKDRELFERKALVYFTEHWDIDDSLSAIPELDLAHVEQEAACLKSRPSKDEENLPVPPNLLYFTLVLEAYLGYKWKSYHPRDPTVPRNAVMGGAVVAALTSWRDPFVSKKMSALGKLIYNRVDSTKSNRYEAAKARILGELHIHFLYCDRDVREELSRTGQDGIDHPHGGSQGQSVFSTGDVDIFLQASPFTRQLLSKLRELGLDADLLHTVESFLGGCGFVQGDLHRLANLVFEDPNSDLHESRFPSETFEYDSWNGIRSCIPDPSRNSGDGFRKEKGRFRALEIPRMTGKNTLIPDPTVPWPRNTQLIRLSEKADLVGGLMDFDISTVTSAYDGTNVHVTPRAAYSLLTLTQIVTPFIMEEQRNWKRILKYWRRGFRAFVLDPNCYHDAQCTSGPFPCERNKASPGVRTETRVDASSWNGTVEELTDFQREHEVTTCRCNGTGTCRPDKYSIVLFEKKKDEFFEFLESEARLPTVIINELKGADPRARMCCRVCRDKYEEYALMKRNPELSLLSDDPVRNEWVLDRGGGHGTDVYRFSFYSGGVFDGKRNRYDPLIFVKASSSLDSQRRGEQARYLVKNETLEGYAHRYVHAAECGNSWQLIPATVDEIFAVASKTTLSDAKRNPVGLNPERFVDACKSCSSWLLHCEFGTEYCEACMNQKPSAV